ncbi:Subtilisin-like protease 2 [Podosphaera aphanis]|nr:Subtilisin-like protease 2 [Podosphaera aphanis]
MISYYVRIVAFAVLIASIFAAPTTAPDYKLKIRSPPGPHYIENSWIVVYRKDVSKLQISSHEQSIKSLINKRDLLGDIKASWNMALLKGYHIKTNEAVIAAIASAPEIEYIERDIRMTASDLTTQSNSPYGLGSISHSSAASTTSYVYDKTGGQGITVYIVDTGIYADHSEFGGRASLGANFIPGSADTDENGHGTHCAGTIGGATYGVAKNATLVGVKVLDADGSGSNSGVISGIDWVAKNAGGTGVLSMSLGGSYSSALNSAVSSTINTGVTVVVAAGNDNANAAFYSPASAAAAITVGAIGQNNAKASFSNYGSVIDVFAPGVNILSSWIGSKTATNTISGTSMATPHVAGLAAYLMSLQRLSSPSAVANRISSLAVSGQITGLPFMTSNRRAYNGAA